MRYATKKGLRSLAIHELAELTKMGVNVLQERKIEKVTVNSNNVKVDNEEFDAVVLAMPGIQAARIIENDEKRF